MRLRCCNVDFFSSEESSSRGWPFANTDTHNVSDNEDAEGRTPGVAPTIRMLSGLSDVVLTHVHRPLEGIERAQRRVTPETPEVSAVARRGTR